MAQPDSRPIRRFPVSASGAVALSLLVLAASWSSGFAGSSSHPGTGPSGLPLPRFVSINSDKVNVRKGPGQQYPIAWVYVRRGMPVEIVAEYDLWRQIRDHDNATGWVQKSLLSGRRTGMIANAAQTLYSDPDPESENVAVLEPGVIGQIKRCKGAWCAFRVKDYSGWVRRDGLWGVLPDETFD